MAKEIAYQNKDITSKYFADIFQGKSLQVYGLNLPKIVEVLPTNLPDIEANELRIDNLFRLENGDIAIIDYESAYKKSSKLKYLEYILRVLKRYKKRDGLNITIRMVVIYTADIEPEEVQNTLDVGAVQLSIESAFLSKLNSDSIEEQIKNKIETGQEFTDEEVMKFIVFPLTYRGVDEKRTAIKRAFEWAKQVKNDKKQLLILSGILVFSDKVIDQETANQIKEWIRMTKVGQLFEEEKQEAVERAVEKAIKQVTEKMAREILEEDEEAAKVMLKDGLSVDQVARYQPNLSINQIKKLKKEMEQN